MAVRPKDDRQLLLDLRGGHAEAPSRRRRKPGERMFLQRAFFALQPEAEDRERLAPILRRHCEEANVLSGRRAEAIWHVSLAGVMAADTIPDAVFERAAELAERVAMPAFEIAFDRLSSFGKGAGVRPLVLEGGEGLDGVRMLQQRLVEAVFRKDEAAAARPFNPHLTLADSSVHVAPTPIAPVRWRARSFVLIQSFVGQRRYEVRGRWALPQIVLEAAA